MTEAPRVSIIISTFNRRVEILKRLFDSIRKQDFKNYEILLIDQGTDKKYNVDNEDLCDEYGANYYNISSQSPSLTISRNFGISKAKGDIVLFLDDDVELLDSNYLSKILEVFEQNQKTVGVSGFGYYNQDKTKIGRILNILKKFFLHVIFAFNPFNTQEVTGYFHNVNFYKKPKELTKVDWLYGFDMAYSKELFEKIRFDENLKLYSLREDVDFSFRAKKFGEIYVTPFARVHHFEEKEGRINFRKRTLMELSYWTYLYYKNIEEPRVFVAKLNSFFIFLRYLKKATFSLKKNNIAAVFSSYRFFIEHFSDAKGQDLHVFNEILSFSGPSLLE